MSSDVGNDRALGVDPTALDRRIPGNARLDHTATSIDYTVVVARRSPTPVRFDTEVAARLSAFTASHPGLSLSAATNLLVDEGLRMTEHPGVVFRDGPSGRRAGLAGGPDIWEVIRAIRSARAAEPELGEDQLLDLVAVNSGVPLRMLRIALGYWASFSSEVDNEIAVADDVETSAEGAWRRERDLLAQ